MNASVFLRKFQCSRILGINIHNVLFDQNRKFVIYCVDDTAVIAMGGIEKIYHGLFPNKEDKLHDSSIDFSEPVGFLGELANWLNG